jgi:acetyltransferase-like isoleucine patch superfamily enzyme
MSRRRDHDWYPVAVPDNVRIGEGSWLYSAYAFRHYSSAAPIGVEIGRSCGLYIGTFFNLGPNGRVRIGDYCTLVGAIISTDGEVEIGDFTFIAHEVVIADRAVAVPPASSAGQTPPSANRVIIGKNAWIGARAVLLSGAVIGADAIVGAGAVVDSIVPPGAVFAGNPARQVVKSRAR